MKKYTTAGTDIESVKQQNANSGMSYNEVKAFLARTTGGHGTARFSNTDVEQVKRNNSPDSQGED
ncbi:gamma-type small acid-soluble spore protein [Mesobacillus foraminis]|uniref:gamma-type small acid-soluble spore protein n=1 Tax=Mesobacillus foraminis TaxID=279826 RepID=UPI001BE7723E|nr:gamma-type small acid-soluble spore protein [Mesobacillus foraminis]MBT2755727.1 gamma-type small acid-soluble spore protein [Mesobacillus foraminis]